MTSKKRDAIKHVGLGLDTGGSSSRWLLLDEQAHELGSGVGPPITGHVFTEAERLENVARLRSLLQTAARVASPSTVVGGVTGLHRGTPPAALLEREVNDVLGLAPKHIHLDNDMSVAYASVLRPGEGVLVYAGTGSVAYHVSQGETVIKAGGYGYLIDDAGGGFWIGQQGLKQVLRWADERLEPKTTPLVRPPARPLESEIYEALGSHDWEEVIGTVYGGGRRQVAALAPAVARAAQTGDEVATQILMQAGAELAALARTVLTRLDVFSLPVVFAGGIAQLSPILTQSLEAHLPQGSSFERKSVEPVRAAARLALELAQATSSPRGSSEPEERP